MVSYSGRDPSIGTCHVVADTHYVKTALESQSRINIATLIGSRRPVNRLLVFHRRELSIWSEVDRSRQGDQIDLPAMAMFIDIPSCVMNARLILTQFSTKAESCHFIDAGEKLRRSAN
jgi:hypothetical protein